MKKWILLFLNLVLAQGALVFAQEPLGNQKIPSSTQIQTVSQQDASISKVLSLAQSIATQFQWESDATQASRGVLLVKALHQGKSIKLKMRFFRKDGDIYIASALTQSAESFVDNIGQTYENKFYAQLLQKTKQAGLTVYADPDAIP